MSFRFPGGRSRKSSDKFRYLLGASPDPQAVPLQRGPVAYRNWPRSAPLRMVQLAGPFWYTPRALPSAEVQATMQTISSFLFLLPYFHLWGQAPSVVLILAKRESGICRFREAQKILFPALCLPASCKQCFDAPNRLLAGRALRTYFVSKNLFQIESFTQFFSKNCGVEGQSPRRRAHAAETLGGEGVVLAWNPKQHAPIAPALFTDTRIFNNYSP